MSFASLQTEPSSICKKQGVQLLMWVKFIFSVNGLMSLKSHFYLSEYKTHVHTCVAHNM